MLKTRNISLNLIKRNLSQHDMYKILWSFSNKVKKPKHIRPEDFSDSEDDTADKNKCLVCKKSNPDWQKKPFILIVNWGQCDICSG